MHCKDTCLIVDLREGQNLAEITNMIAVLSAAGWKTTISLKEYGGETLKLARQAAEQGYDAIIAYGGDGTLNQVVNGVMDVGGKNIVGVSP
ncbi:MAG TPA: acylglycerol kinase family protein, partial [Ktedonobacteraceae bacterium]|nr:acylglycerol kinase family protein [Ktedonobacteraceae bacterium]